MWRGVRVGASALTLTLSLTEYSMAVHPGIAILRLARSIAVVAVAMADDAASTAVAPSIVAAARVVFLESPTADAIKTYLDTIMLLSTLMFGFAVAFLTSFSQQDLAAADERWHGWCTNSTIRALPRIDEWCGSGLVLSGNAPPLENFQHWRFRPSYVLGERAVFTYGFFAMSLALAVIQYLLMLGFRIDACSDEHRQKWWLFYQWPCHLAMAFFLVGLTFFVLTLSIVMRIIFVADVDLLLGGARHGVWSLVQTVGWTIAGLMAAQVVVNGGIWLVVWRRSSSQKKSSSYPPS